MNNPGHHQLFRVRSLSGRRRAGRACRSTRGSLARTSRFSGYREPDKCPVTLALALVAQWIEHLPPKQGVARSIRAGGSLGVVRAERLVAEKGGGHRVSPVAACADGENPS